MAPTILELAGAPIPASFEGRGLLSLLAGGAVEEGSERKIHSISTRNPGEAALVQGRWKLIRSGSGTLELFDLLEDPEERRSRSREEPAIKRRYARELRQVTPERGSSARPVAPPLEKGEKERLRALGYIE